MTITLEAIKAEQTKVAEMIAAFEKQAAAQYHIKAAMIALAHGERYAGILLGDGDEPDHHLILLPGEAEDLEWSAAVEWAKEKGGELPTRREQSLLFANLKGEFQSAYYWSSQEHETNSGWAWCQNFELGNQTSTGKGNHCRARAVRRLVIE